MIATASGAAPQAGADLDVSISGLRNNEGAVMLCLTRRGQKLFLKCADDPARSTQIVPAGNARHIRFSGLPPGEYSLLVIHDENRNGKLDTMMGIPREGFGFSRNPAIRMGPPRYRDVHFALGSGRNSQAVQLKYLL